MRRIKIFLIAMAIALTTSYATVTSKNSVGPTIVGVWLVKTTPQNCTTGEPTPANAFEAIYTFHADGTMLASFRNNSLTLERTAAHGIWRHDPVYGGYLFKFVHIRRQVEAGTFAGKQESAGRAVVAEGGDEFSSLSTTTVFNPSGIPNSASSCAGSEGTRLKLDP